jgi:glycosyltransferase involved in cell wall biosynthesis
VFEVDLSTESLVSGEARLRLRRALRAALFSVLTATAFLQSRLRRFAQRAHRVFRPTASADPFGTPGVETLDLNAESPVSREAWLRFSRPFHAVVHRWLTARALLRALRRCRPDVVHVYYAYGDYAWLAGLFGCRPLVITVEGGDVLFEEQGSPTTAGKWLTVRLLRQADYITTQSSFLANAVNRLGDFRAKTERILWGISLDEFRRRDASALRLELGLRPGARVILSPKILQPFYRVHLVVEAMAIVRRHCPDALLVVSEYGADPAYREQLARLVAELDLGEHVLFAGVVAHEDMPDYYSLAELSIAVPPSDGLPQALLESLACGTPQILSRLSRYEEIVQHEESAYFVDASPEAIAAGIVRLLADTTLRSRIAARGRSVVEQQANIDEQAARVERRFGELAAATRPRTLRASALLSAGLAGAQTYLSLRNARDRAGTRPGG